MPVVYLRDQQRVWLGGVEQGGLFLAGEKVWAKPAVAAGIAQFYGVDAGRIPGDWRADEPTVSGGLVTHIRNDGGAGALFDLSNSTGDGPAWINGFVVPGGATPTPMAFAQDPDLMGVHLLAVIDPAGVTSNGDILSGTKKGNARIAVNDTRMLLGPAGQPAFVEGVYAPRSGLNLIEARWDSAGVTLIANSDLVASIPPPSVSSFRIYGFGQSRDGALNAFSGPVGRWISVICADGHSATAPEPAVVAARALLQQQYGIAS